MSTPSTYNLNGSVTTTPQQGMASGLFGVAALLTSLYNLTRQFENQYDLDSDTAVPVVSGLNANVLVVKPIGGAVTLRITTTAGTQQLIVLDDLFILQSQTTTVTALDLIRAPGVPVSVSVFMGQVA